MYICLMLPLRVDGSSKFGTDNKTGLFWSLGAGIALHNYDFIKNIGFIDELKLRGLMVPLVK